MKKLLLSFLLGCSCLCAAKAQGTDFAPVGARWYYDELDFAQRNIPHIIECVGKEYYANQWCSKLVSSSLGVLPDPVYVFTRNDTVFFFSTLTNQFEMLYDFTAGVGDSWVVGGVYSQDNNENVLLADTIRVDSISYALISGDTLKVWHISHGFFYDWGSRIYEKAGNDMLFAPKFGLWDLQIGGLRCFENPDTTYHFVPYPCDSILLTTGVHSLNTLQPIAVSPNPATNRVLLSLSEPAHGQWLLADLSGRPVMNGLWEGTSLTVATETIKPGLYIFRLQANDGRTFAGKIILRP